MSRCGDVEDPDNEIFRVSKKDMSRHVRTEIGRQCAHAGANNNFQWPEQFIISVRFDAVGFFDTSMKFLVEIAEGDHGFQATRAYVLSLCKGSMACGIPFLTQAA